MSINKKLSYVYRNLGKAAIFEQMAEEAAEVAQAALKCARIERQENPTPIENEEALNNLIEEMTDLELCRDVCGIPSGWLEKPLFDINIYEYKLRRWVKRIKKNKKNTSDNIFNNGFYEVQPPSPQEKFDELYEALGYTTSGGFRKNLNPDDYLIGPEVYTQFDMWMGDEPENEENDPVNHPSHYCREGSSIETIDAIEASMTHEEYKGYLKGNAEKYIWRYDMKGHAIQDLEKAIFYLNKLIEVLKEEKEDADNK